MNELLEQLQTAQQELDPRFKALRTAIGALKRAIKLAGEEKTDALAMQKALTKLEQANALIESAEMASATSAFAAETQQALDDLAFEFAQDLRETFEQRGQPVAGRPPTLIVGELVLNIDIAARKAQWFYGKEALTRPIALSINTIMKAYDRQHRTLIERTIDADAFLRELYQTWQEMLETRSRRPTGNRIGLIELYSKLVLNRQTSRFWNAPSRSTFKDYDRALFVRDLVLVRAAPVVDDDGRSWRVRLGVATKSQADSASRSIWLPSRPPDGEYYSDITFEEA